MEKVPFRWNAKNLTRRVEAWVFDLESFPKLMSLIRELDQQGEDWHQFEKLIDPKSENVLIAEWIRSSRALISKIKNLLYRDTGVVIVKCGPRISSNQARWAELLIGCGLGTNNRNVTQIPKAKENRPLFQATVNKDSTAEKTYVGNGYKRNAIGLHVDGSGSNGRLIEILVMLFLRQARFGGQSRVANSQLVFDNLSIRSKRTLQKSFPRESPYKPGIGIPPTSLACAPIYKSISDNNGDERILINRFSYHPSRVRNGWKFTHTEKSKIVAVEYDPDQIDTDLSQELNEALTELDKRLEDNACEITLMQNDLLLLNNQVIAHDRVEFQDDARAPRLMERLWVGKFNKEEAEHLIGIEKCNNCREENRNTRSNTSTEGFGEAGA
ncbi:MAG: TauD/TfdA family dioxygenase [Planctomycetes bacterium]|nr:TauD/TfdA family dioxygenase [Planctomycetota bacterium]